MGHRLLQSGIAEKENPTDLELDEAEPQVLGPGEHLGVELLAREPEQVQLNLLSDLTYFIPKISVAEKYYLCKNEK